MQLLGIIPQVHALSVEKPLFYVVPTHVQKLE